MRKEDLFEVLGALDDDIVKDAKAPQKKLVNRKVWGAMAACLALACVLSARFLLPDHGDDAISQSVGDAAPMIYLNDTLYIQSSDQQGYPELKDEFLYLGKIESMVSEAGTPAENFQANHPVVGCEVYQYGENIVVHINGAYWLYMEYGEPEISWDDLTEPQKEALDPTYNK